MISKRLDSIAGKPSCANGEGELQQAAKLQWVAPHVEELPGLTRLTLLTPEETTNDIGPGVYGTSSSVFTYPVD